MPELFGYKNIHTYYVNVSVPAYSQEGVQGAVLHVFHHDHHWPACIHRNTQYTGKMARDAMLEGNPKEWGTKQSALSKQTQVPRTLFAVHCCGLWSQWTRPQGARTYGAITVLLTLSSSWECKVTLAHFKHVTYSRNDLHKKTLATIHRVIQRFMFG